MDFVKLLAQARSQLPDGYASIILPGPFGSVLPIVREKSTIRGLAHASLAHAALGKIRMKRKATAQKKVV